MLHLRLVVLKPVSMTYRRVTLIILPGTLAGGRMYAVRGLVTHLQVLEERWPKVEGDEGSASCALLVRGTVALQTKAFCSKAAFAFSFSCAGGL